MPFKEACIPLVDELDASAQAIHSVNTIVNTNGHLKAYNTDYIAIARLLANYKVSPDLVFALRGSGGMAKAVACALKDAGLPVVILSRLMKRQVNNWPNSMAMNGARIPTVLKLIC